MKQPSAIIFDMDGVIVDTEPLHERTFYEVIESLGYDRHHGLCFDNYVGRSDFELWRDFVAKHQPSQKIEELLDLKRQRVIKVILQEEPVFPGLVPLLEKLHGRFRLALATGSERVVVQTVMSLQNLQRFFPLVVTAAEVEHGKPAPDIFLLTARKLSVAPEDCWVIEDSKPGVMAGRAAGMRVIAITNTHPAEELGQAHHIVQNYEEIDSLLSL
jgi:HAD superfamily hydrolase (TIGR01509 family)